MTEPQVATGPLNVNLTANVIQGPDGQPWIRYDISLGVTSFALAIPVEIAKQMPALWTDITTQILSKLPGQGLILPVGAGGLLIAQQT